MTGGELKALRKKVGLRAYEIAEMLEYSAAQWSAFENGRSPIPKVVALATRYLCSPTITEESKGDKLIAVLKEVLEDGTQVSKVRS